MNIAGVFDVAASDYDITRKKYISCFDDFYGVAVEQIPHKKSDSFSILDLGAGTGLFSALVKEVFPACKLTLTDISTEMLKKAKERFHGLENIDFVVHDYINEEFSGEYDVAISALSLHHSTHQELDSVFNKIYSCLKANGIFINADQILGRTAEIEKIYEKSWLEQAKSNGCTNKEIKIALKRMEADKRLPLSNQLSLLEKAGFARVNCWYQHYRYIVYSGSKSS